MVDLLKKLQYPPWRKRAMRAILAFPFIVGPLCFVLMGPAQGLIIFLAAFGIYALRSDLPARPRLTVAFANDESIARRMVIGDQRRPGLDIEGIVEERTRDARTTMPRMPMPVYPQGTKLGAMFSSTKMSMLRSALEPSDSELRKFLGEVNDYSEELEGWLGDYADARVLRLREVKAAFRIDNDGEAAGESLRLRLRFPKGFIDLADDDLHIDQPPERPTFTSGFAIPKVPSLIPQRIRPIFSAPLPEVVKGTAPAYFRDGDQLIVEYNLGTLNHGPDYLRTSPCQVRTPSEGTYEIEWEISAGNLPETAKGKLELEVRTPPEREPAMTTLDEVLSEREELALD